MQRTRRLLRILRILRERWLVLQLQLLAGGRPLLKPALSSTLARCRSLLIDRDAHVCVAVKDVDASIRLRLVVQYLLNGLPLVSVVAAHHLLPYGVV